MVSDGGRAECCGGPEDKFPLLWMLSPTLSSIENEINQKKSDNNADEIHQIKYHNKAAQVVQVAVLAVMVGKIFYYSCHHTLYSHKDTEVAVLNDQGQSLHFASRPS